ncbi:FAD-binding oxidoreductase [Parasphingorhabdus sp. DH2-15]|uniref:FAD-binding oxidoreductase n=1 Tax=Parasphingorhabdus sp. DH2-15 TaxID=3444112 RepID=UPI003F68371F
MGISSQYDADMASLYALSQGAHAPHVTIDQSDIQPWLTDWRGRYTGNAMASVSPRNVKEVQHAVHWARHYNVALVPQGGNSGMVGGATPDESGRSIILSLRKMTAIRDIDIDGRTVVADAGVVLQNLHEAVAEKDLRFPLTLGGKGSATIGGLVATNAGGTQVLRHGNMRALVAGVEAVLPNGEVFDGLKALKKDNRGFDLNQLLVGSEGTIGIVTAARLRLVPQLIDRTVIWAGLDTIQQARKLLLHCQEMCSAAVEGFEVIPQTCLDAVLKHIPATKAPLSSRHDWYCLIELVQDDPAQHSPATLAEAIMEQALKKDLVQNAVISASEAQTEAFWKLRDSISEAERAAGPAVQHDISVPVQDMPDFISTVIPQVEQQFAGTRAIAFGHLGDGNVHFHVIAPQGSISEKWYAEDSKAISDWVYRQVMAWGGSISAEHGIGQMKRDILHELDSPARIFALKGIKQGLDPANIMNPGKLISNL